MKLIPLCEILAHTEIKGNEAVDKATDMSGMVSIRLLYTEYYPTNSWASNLK